MPVCVCVVCAVVVVVPVELRVASSYRAPSRTTGNCNLNRTQSSQLSKPTHTHKRPVAHSVSDFVFKSCECVCVRVCAFACVCVCVCISVGTLSACVCLQVICAPTQTTFGGAQPSCSVGVCIRRCLGVLVVRRVRLLVSEYTTRKTTLVVVKTPPATTTIIVCIPRCSLSLSLCSSLLSEIQRV